MLKARATAAGISELASAIQASPRGNEAVSLRIAEKYVDAFSELAKESTTMLLPSKVGDPASMVAQVR